MPQPSTTIDGYRADYSARAGVLAGDLLSPVPRAMFGGEVLEMSAELAEIKSDMKYVRRDVEDLRGDTKAIQKDTSDLKTAVARLEEKAKTLLTERTALLYLGGLLTVGSAVAIFLNKIRELLGA